MGNSWNYRRPFYFAPTTILPLVAAAVLALGTAAQSSRIDWASAVISSTAADAAFALGKPDGVTMSGNVTGTGTHVFGGFGSGERSSNVRPSGSVISPPLALCVPPLAAKPVTWITVPIATMLLLKPRRSSTFGLPASIIQVSTLPSGPFTSI